MLVWRIAEAKRAIDLPESGNDQNVPVVYMSLTPAICSLENFMHADGEPTFPMKIICFKLPVERSLYWEPDPKTLPSGWASLPGDRPSMDFGIVWLKANKHLG